MSHASCCVRGLPIILLPFIMLFTSPNFRIRGFYRYMICTRCVVLWQRACGRSCWVNPRAFTLRPSLTPAPRSRMFFVPRSPHEMKDGRVPTTTASKSCSATRYKPKPMVVRRALFCAIRSHPFRPFILSVSRNSTRCPSYDCDGRY